MNVYKIIPALVAIFFFLACAKKEEYLFRDTSLPIEQRVEDLVSRLTLEEKVLQMASTTPAIERLGIPPYDWQNECLHGVGKLAEYKVTVYPQPIGMAATWDENSILKMADYTAEEGRAVYNDTSAKKKFGSYYGLTYWSPNINIFRDPRWGRGHETFGEDPYLTGTLGKAFVRGLQGDDPDYLKASACAKHYAVHSGPESLRHEFNTEVSTYDLWDTYLTSFKDLVVDAKVTGIMCAYNAYAGRPCCGNDLLMIDILRNKWKFTGYVTSDCGAIDDFYTYHKTHPDTISAAVDAVMHGTDLDCIRDIAFKTLVEAVKQGRIEERKIDEAVKRLFTIRFRLGFFDPQDKVKYSNITIDALDRQEHKDHALKMAQQSIVLLKNENQTLPLRKNLRKIAVVGPNATTEIGLLGNYHGYPSKIVNLLEGIRRKVSPQTEVYYQKMVDYIDIDSFVSEDRRDEFTYNGNTGYYAEYYNNLDFSGTALSELQKDIDLSYMGETEIAKGIKSTSFSVRYTTLFRPKETKVQTLNIDTDKRIKLIINNEVKIDALEGKTKPNGLYTSTFEKGKEYKIVIEAVMKGRHGKLFFNLGRIENPSLNSLAMGVKDADVIIFAGGISPELEGEQNGVDCEGFQDGDRTTIKLPKIQTMLLKELKKTGKPVVFVMMTGSAIAIDWEDKNLPAILNAWYGGQSAGTAIADVLFGDYNPSGRLPVTFYKDDKDLPPFTDYSMKDRTYRYFKGESLYSFGHGLSYTTFAYDNLQVPEKVTTTGTISVKVNVTNTGQRDGEEVIQLYISHLLEDNHNLVRSLKGFKRIALKKGESQSVEFVLTPKDISRWNDSGEQTVSPGNIQLSIGGCQPEKKFEGTNKFLIKTIKIEGNKNKLVSN
ncbi:beta-glucosidase [Dysgonomonas alginatilytica]|uniref:Beta-glucosidase n=1 Tax=Dysgonomonas alginatilytica TaxID=1605892 RepID=A0A2V3PJI7_9BACT|nr:glycoside hydrolase family 3 C-terminal domain-containing protein [Dysgonomonas alginatilytica]PXV59952.1 beta-glucosidase [Dysgonomonas alginatilytica]